MIIMGFINFIAPGIIDEKFILYRFINKELNKMKWIDFEENWPPTLMNVLVIFETKNLSGVIGRFLCEAFFCPEDEIFYYPAAMRLDIEGENVDMPTGWKPIAWTLLPDFPNIQ
jgi:hypothetical protein